MAITLTKPYQGFASGTTVQFPTSVEADLIAQGFGTAATGYPAQSAVALTPFASSIPYTVGGNVTLQPGSGISVPTTPQGPRILPNGTILAFASLGTDTIPVAGTLYRSEIYVPHLATWTGIGILNGSVAATDSAIVALYDSNGMLIANSALAGTVASGVNSFQQRAFVNTVTLAPGRYFIGVQISGTTARFRTWAAANGGNQMTSSATGTFGTLPASFTAPTTFTADVGPIAHLYV